MASLVIELQKDSLNPSIHITDLLRKALLVSKKLKIKDIDEWLSNEMNGYTDKIPDYREVRGLIKGRDGYGRWIDFAVHSEIFEPFEYRKLPVPISQLETVLTQSEDGFFRLYFPSEAAALLSNLMGGGYNPALSVPTHQIVKIIDVVKNKILEFAVDLENRGVFGEGMVFTQDEKEKAQNITYNTINIHHMENSQLQQDSIGSKQS